MSHALWDAASGKQLFKIMQKGHAEGLAISPDGQSFASAFSENPLHIWSLADGKERLALPGAHGPIAFSPDGSLAATYYLEKKNMLRIINSTNGAPILTFHGPGYAIDSICFSPDGHRILTAGSTIQLWDASTGRELLSYANAFQSRAAFSPDGCMIGFTASSNAFLFIASKPAEVARPMK